MTLDTRIYITSPADHREIFDKVNDLLGIPKDRVETDTSIEDDDYWSKYGTREISNAPMQGFAAWVMSYSNYDGTLVTFDRTPDEDGDAEERPDYYIQISMDTAYGYQGDHGETCTMLHAKVIVDLGNWLNEKGLTWVWYNEYTGTYHEGFEGLEEFLDNGDSARAWFRDTVLPAIRAEIEKS